MPGRRGAGHAVAEQSITVDAIPRTVPAGRRAEHAGVDVPYGFDGAFTVTVAGAADASFTLVRHIAKEEAPLAALAGNARHHQRRSRRSPSTAATRPAAR